MALAVVRRIFLKAAFCHLPVPVRVTEELPNVQDSECLVTVWTKKYFDSENLTDAAVQCTPLSTTGGSSYTATTTGRI